MSKSSKRKNGKASGTWSESTKSNTESSLNDKHGEKIPRYRNRNATYEASACTPMRKAAAEGQIEFGAITHGHYFGTSLPPKTLEGVSTTGYWNARTEQNWGLTWHRNEGLELDFQESGHNGFATSEQSTTLRAGDLAMVRPWQLHQFGTPNVRRGIRVWMILDVGITNPRSKWKWPSWIVLTEQDKNTLSSALLNRADPVFHLPASDTTSWKKLLKELKSGYDKLNVSLVAILVNEILLSLLGIIGKQSLNDSSEVSLVMRIMQDFLHDFEVRPHLLRKQWTLSEMARQCGMSPSGFSRYFREYTNSSPGQYLAQLRIKRAKDMLKTDHDYPIQYLAEEVGFGSSQYFATVFKKVTGLSPSEFVKEQE